MQEYDKLPERDMGNRGSDGRGTLAFDEINFVSNESQNRILLIYRAVNLKDNGILVWKSR
jgi:hypothetical protein